MRLTLSSEKVTAAVCNKNDRNGENKTMEMRSHAAVVTERIDLGREGVREYVTSH